MARARNIKPGFFHNEDLADLGTDCMVLFAGLWTIADRDGRLEDRPRRIKAEIFPYFDKLNIETLLNKLISKNFIVRYEVNGNKYIYIPTWDKHQTPHVREVPSTIPAPNTPVQSTTQAVPSTSQGNVEPVPSTSDSLNLIPDSLNQGTDVPSTVLNGNGSGKPKPPTSQERTDWFKREFWPVVWSKIGYGKALEKWLARVHTRADCDLLVQEAKKQGPGIIQHAAENGHSVLHPATWIGQQRYRDEPGPLLTPKPAVHQPTNETSLYRRVGPDETW